jgi:hypothetical protein
MVLEKGKNTSAIFELAAEEFAPATRLAKSSATIQSRRDLKKGTELFIRITNLITLITWQLGVIYFIALKFLPI